MYTIPVVVNVEMADLVGSPCEVVVIAAISLIVFTMFFGICTVTVMPAPAPAASGPILVGMTVVVKIVLPTAGAGRAATRDLGEK